MSWSCNPCLLQGLHVLCLSRVCRSAVAGQRWLEVGPVALAVLALWTQICILLLGYLLQGVRHPMLGSTPKCVLRLLRNTCSGHITVQPVW